MNKNREAGKGSKPIPMNITREVYEENWDRIFKRESPKAPENAPEALESTQASE